MLYFNNVEWAMSSPISRIRDDKGGNTSDFLLKFKRLSIEYLIQCIFYSVFYICKLGYKTDFTKRCEYINMCFNHETQQKAGWESMMSFLAIKALESDAVFLECNFGTVSYDFSKSAFSKHKSYPCIWKYAQYSRANKRKE